MTPLLRADALAVRHGFFTRAGGVSDGAYASLNCSVSGRDDPARVAENRARAAWAVGCAPAALIGVSQVHGVEVATVERSWVAGTGPAADAMVTRTRGLALGIVTADCAPVLLADPASGVIGAAHAGWRGAAAGVLEATLAAMAALGARPERVVAVVGPCIGQASYEVGPDVHDAAMANHARFATWFAPWFAPGRDAAHWQFDLGGYCMARLSASGVARVERIEADTAAEPERFFSHRRRTLSGGGPIGHQISVIVLPA